MAKISGIRLITAERKRQIEKEGWSLKHDLEEHSEGDLALAAICYATPVRIFERLDYAHGVNFVDPWPFDGEWDKRFSYGERRSNPGNVPPNPETYTKEERIDLLVKAGALIAAEIDRLQGQEDSDERLKNLMESTAFSPIFGQHRSNTRV